MIKKILLFLAMVCLSSALAEDWDGSTSKPSSREIDGVEYYVITSPSELAWFAYQVTKNGNNQINAILDHDIYFMDDSLATNTIATSVIGNSSHPFDGIIDGNGKTIYGAKGNYLIGTNTEKSIIKNLILKYVNYAGLLDTNKGEVENIHYYGKTNYGIARHNEGLVKNVENFAVSKYSGVVYYNAVNGKIDSCLYKGTTDKVDSIFGGIVYENRGSIKNSKTDINVQGYFTADGESYFGGIAGKNLGHISNSFANMGIEDFRFGKNTGRLFVGGVSGHNQGEIFMSQSNLVIGQIPYYNPSSGYGYAIFIGGLSGTNEGKIYQSQSSLKVNTIKKNGLYSVYMGGAVGSSYNTYRTYSIAEIDQIYSEFLIDSCYKKSAVQPAEYFVAGLIGHSPNTNINNSHSRFHINYMTSEPDADYFMPVSLTNNTDVRLLFKGDASILPAQKESSIKNSYGVITWNENTSKYLHPYGLFYSVNANVSVSNVYYDKEIYDCDSIKAYATTSSESMYNVIGKTTTTMQSPAFVETLNTNAGLDDDSGIWQYCEGNYPILVSEGSCDGFYSKYGLSSNSQSSSSSDASLEESSSSESISSSSSGLIIESSSSEEINISSSSNVFVSSSSVEVSSSSEETISSSSKKESSSSMESVSSSATTFVYDVVRNSFNLAVNGMTLTLSNTQGGTVQIFDALGHLVTTRLLSANGSTNITMPTVGSYIVRVNGETQMVTLR